MLYYVKQMNETSTISRVSTKYHGDLLAIVNLVYNEREREVEEERRS